MYKPGCFLLALSIGMGGNGILNASPVNSYLTSSKQLVVSQLSKKNEKPPQYGSIQEEVTRTTGSDIHSGSPDWWLAVFTGVLVLIAFFQLLLFYWQLRIMRRGIDDSTVSANAASASAQATAESVRIMRETAERQLRAYISGQASSFKYDATKKNVVVEVHFKNFGQTPAYNVRCWMGVTVREHPLGSLLQNPPVELPLAKEVLAPSRHSIITVPTRELSDLEINQFMSGQTVVYAFGEISYSDAFGQHRVTKFRLIGKSEDIEKGMMCPDTDGNEAE